LLDYTKTIYAARLKEVNKLIQENKSAIYKYFHKVHLNKNDKLSEETHIGKLLDMAGLYLYGKDEREADDAEKRQYNYKLEKKIKIMAEDYEKIPELLELKNAIDYLNSKKEQIDDDELKSKLEKWIADLKTNQKDIKEMLLRPIDFKKIPPEYHVDEYGSSPEELWQAFYPYEGQNRYDVDLFKVDSWEGVLRILPFTEVKGKYIEKYLKIFEVISPLCTFTDDETKVLNSMRRNKKDHYKKLDRDDYKIYKTCFLTNNDIAKRLRMDQKDVFRYVRSIATKLCKEYKKYFIEQWYYVFYVRGQYKTCKQCGETKLISHFANDSSCADGKKAICKECFNSNYKVCSKCGKKLNKNMFGNDDRNKDGLKSICKICDKL
jgi:hypothetical protein